MTRILYIVGFLSIVLCLYFLFKPEKANFSQQFKYEGSLDKIFLADMVGNSVLLMKTNGKWKLDKELPVRPDLIKLLLNTIKRVDIKAPVPAKQKDAIIKRIATNGIKVELYNNDDLVHQYYVGDPTQNQEGTYMYNESLQKVYITHIPGFIGYLSPRYSTNKEEWRDRALIKYKAKDIQSISINYREDTKLSSFELELSPLKLSINGIEQADSLIQKEAIKSYLSFFKHLEIEGYENSYSKRDSVLNSKPFCELSIKAKNKSQYLRFFNKPINQRSKLQFDVKGQALKYDIDRLFIDFNKGKDFGIAQMYVFGKILRKPEDFLR